MARMERTPIASFDLSIDYERIDVTDSRPTPNTRWRFTDQAGHEHYYLNGYPTLDLVVDEEHWCDGTEGIAPHDPHMQIDASHYECLQCRETITPKMDPPGTPKHLTGAATYRLTGLRSDGAEVTALITDADYQRLTADPTDDTATAILDAAPDNQIESVTYSSW